MYSDVSRLVRVPIGETKESFLKCRIGNLKRIQDLYSKSVLKEIHCFSGEIMMDFNKLNLDIEKLIKELEDLQ
jgi:hypothetical protein